MAESISSTKNEYIKSLKLLSKKSEREARKLFIAEGILCVGEALNYAEVDAFLYTEKYVDSLERKLAEEKGVRCILVSEEVMNAVCSSKNPQGAFAIVKKTEMKYEKKGLFLLLENLSDPQNVGTMIRTADAMGASAVILTKESADAFAAACVRATMGSIFHIPVIYSQDIYAVAEDLKANGVGIVAGHLKGSGTFPKYKNTAIFIGNETRGLSEKASSLADSLYKIPMYGRAESLNAAIAAAILMQKASEAMHE